MSPEVRNVYLRKSSSESACFSAVPVMKVQVIILNVGVFSEDIKT